MELPLVSVILPVYNGEKHLREALTSVFSQDHRPLDVIVVDDGSTDGSARVASERPEFRCMTLPHQGIAQALNAGVKAARGQFVTFLDQDDHWTPHSVSTRLSHLLAHPRTGMVMGRMHNYLEEGAPTPTTADKQEGDTTLLQLGVLMVRREVLDQVGPFSSAFIHASDLDFFIRAREARIVHDLLPDILLRRRLHDSNLSYASTPRERLLALKASIGRKREHSRR